MTTDITCITSDIRPQGIPRLAVIIPFYHYDPEPLLHELIQQAQALNGAVELILFDDGTQDENLTMHLSSAVTAARAPATLITALSNRGRAKGRNQAAQAALAPWLLFLDSDMLPDRPDFLRIWLGLTDDISHPVVFGGYSHQRTPQDHKTRLHRYMAKSSDCEPAAVRNRNPARYLCTSNLLVQRDVFLTHRFDEQFRGWGWEDVEWALRVQNHHPILHIDNSASHLGLDRVDQLIGKYHQSADNYAHLAHRHPEALRLYTSYRIARLLKPLRIAFPVLRPLWHSVANSSLPLALRSLALKLYRASLYSEALGT